MDALRCGVNRQHDVELLGLFEEGQELAMAEEPVLADGREHRSYEAHALHASQLVDCLGYVLDGQRRDDLEAGAVRGELVVDEVVVGLADGDVQIRLPDEAGGEARDVGKSTAVSMPPSSMASSQVLWSRASLPRVPLRLMFQ